MRGGARAAYVFFNEGPLFCCYGHRTQKGNMGKDRKKEVQHEKGEESIDGMDQMNRTEEQKHFKSPQKWG